MDATHDCISKVRQSLKENDPLIGWVRFSLTTIVSMDEDNGINKTGQEIEYSYVHKKKNGEEVTKTRKSFVTHTFCPFCGEKY